MEFGVMMFPTEYSIGVVELGRAVEGLGFDSLWLPEHTHIPASRQTPFPSGGELPKQYSHSLDLFVGLAAVAVTTTTLKIGSGICLVIERDPITLAKEVASLDHLSGGRFLFGIGGGWNREEMANHGTEPRFRWRVLRERILAMQAIWTNDEAEYHGRFVNFDPLWSWPKPLQKPHPPILMGGDGPKAVEGLLEYCDEWMPHPGRTDRTMAERIADMRRRAAEAGRGEIPVTVFGGQAEAAEIAEYRAAGARGLVVRMPSAPADEVLPILKRYAAVAKDFR